MSQPLFVYFEIVHPSCVSRLGKLWGWGWEWKGNPLGFLDICVYAMGSLVPSAVGFVEDVVTDGPTD